MQTAVIRASSQPGPSGSAELRINVREGCRPVSWLMIDAPCSPSSDCWAITTRFITLVRAAMLRTSTPSTSVVSLGWAQIRASSRSIPSIVEARDAQRNWGVPIGTRPSITIGPPLPGALVIGLPPGPSDPPPAPAIAGHQLVGFRRAPRAGLVVREGRCGHVDPGLQNRSDDRPGFLDLVGPGEQ